MTDIEDILWEMFNEERGQFGASGSPTRIAEVLTEKLTSDEAVERAARSLFYGDIDPDLDVTWATAHEGVRTEYLAMARAALTAAIGGK